MFKKLLRLLVLGIFGYFIGSLFGRIVSALMTGAIDLFTNN